MPDDFSADVSTTSHVESGVGASRLFIAILLIGGMALVSWFVLRQPTNDIPGGAPASEPATASTAAVTTSATPSRQLPPIDILPAARDFDQPMALLPILGGARVDDPLIAILENGRLRYRSLEASVWTGNDDRIIRLNPGSTPHPISVTDSGIALTTLGGVHFQDMELAEPSVALAQGLSTLRSALPDHIWVIGSAGTNVAHIDVRTSTVEAVGSLEGAGYPLASTSNGLLLAPDADGSLDYEVWHPTMTATRLADTGAMKLLGSSFDVALFQDSDDLVVVDLADGDVVRRVRVDFPEFATGSIVSPGGSQLAISFQPSIVENNTIIAVDTTTGDATVVATDAIPWQFQWVDETRLSYMQSDFPVFRVAVHDLTTGQSDALVEFGEFTWWFATKPVSPS